MLVSLSCLIPNPGSLLKRSSFAAFMRNGQPVRSKLTITAVERKKERLLIDL